MSSQIADSITRTGLDAHLEHLTDPHPPVPDRVHLRSLRSPPPGRASAAGKSEPERKLI